MKPKIWIAGALTLAVVAGGGLLATKVFLGAKSDDAVHLVPADAGAYLNLFVRPSNAQKMALEDLLAKFPQLGDSFEDARDALIDVLDPELAKIGLEFEADVDPWLGDQIAFYVMPPEVDVSQSGEGEFDLAPVTQPDVAAIISVKDDDAAQDAVDKVLASEDLEAEGASYEGTDYLLVPQDDVDVAVGFLEDFMILGTEPALKLSVDAFRGDSLDESNAYEAAVGGFADDQLATMYFDTESLVAATVDASAIPTEDRAGMAGLAESGPIAVALHVRSDAAVLEASIGLPDDPALLDIVDGFAGEGAGRILDSLPSDTWFAFGVPQLGRAVSGLVASIEGASPTVGSDELSEAFESQTGLDLQEDVLSWMGSTGLFVQGTIVRDLGGALVIESSDADKTDAVVARIREAVDSEDPTSAQDFEAGGLTGFSVALPPPAAPIFVMGGDRAVIAYGERALNDALAPASALGDSDQFSQAIDGLGDGYEPTFYFDLTAIPKLVQAFTVFGGDPGPSYESDVKPVLESLDYAVVGSKREDETLLQRFVIGVQDGEE